MKPVNKTVQQIEQSAAAAGAGAGLIGVIVTGISASTQKSRRDARLDIYGYNDVFVTFKH
jgi:urea transporter